MAIMRKIADGTFVGPMLEDSAEYRYLQGLRDGSGVHPLWEETGVEDMEAAGALIDGKVATTIQAVMAALAVGVDELLTVGRAPYAGTVAKVEYIPISTITGANTNSRTFNAINGGQAGAGVVNVATLAMVNGVNASAEVPAALTLNATPANLVVANGDLIQFQSLHVGTGIADPGGLVVVTFTRE